MLQVAKEGQQNQQKEQDINQLLKVRREKLEELQGEGKNPFIITKYDVTITARKLRIILKN